MSISINLLPDLRQAKLRVRRRRQMALGISVLVWAICGGSVVVLFLYNAGQKGLIALHDRSIADNKAKLESVEGLTDALTAQQHLAALPALYSERVLYTKFFEAYTQGDPLDITLDTLMVDEQNTLQVNGTGKTFAAVAKLARALETLNVTLGDNAAPANTPYFSSVEIASTENTPGKGVVFTLSAIVASEVLRASN
jgi:hypothetical protein